MKDPKKYAHYADKIPIFHGLSPEEVEAMLHHGKRLYYRAGETIFHEGMLGSNLFIVLSGTVGIYHKEDLIAKCQVGDAFGEMAVLNKRPRSATAVSITESKLLTFEERQINEFLEKHVAVRLLMNVVHVLSERLENANATNVNLRERIE